MRLVLACVVCCPLLAQFSNLVTNDDGSVLYFSSTLRQRGTEQFAHAKLFVLDSGGLRLFRQRPLERTTSPDATWPVSTYYSMEGVALNGSGSSVAVVARRDCYGGSGCLPTPKYRSEMANREFRGRMQLSRNGRYALLGDDGSIVPFYSLVDLETGSRREWMANAGAVARYGRRRVASDGTVVVVRGGTELRVMKLDAERTISLSERSIDIVVDDAGRQAVYETETGLYAINLATEEVRLAAPRQGSGPMQASLSYDGTVLLYVIGGLPQVYVGSRRLTDDPSGVREAVLSGDGRVAYAVTGAGRLLRIAVESGRIEELIGQTPLLQTMLPTAVAGSAFTIRGRGFAQLGVSAAPSLPRELNGVKVLLDGGPVPLQTVEPERIVFQTPWEASAGTHRLEVVTGTYGFFETEGATLEVSHTPLPQFEASSDMSVSLSPYPLATRQDFSALITRANPARRGEIIHLYMTGLGPVEPAVASGEPGPSDPPARLITPLRCVFFPGEIPAEVFFAGLAPGFVGYYQVSLRIPLDAQSSNGDTLFSCGTTAWLPLED